MQAVYGAVFIYRMFAWKTLIVGGESALLELEIQNAQDLINSNANTLVVSQSQIDLSLIHI